MKILILVLSYDDNGGIYSKFYESQKKTWDSENIDNVKTFYFFGNHHTNEIINDKLLVNVAETGINICGYKTLEAFELIKNFDYDVLFRTNSSSYVDKKELTNFVKDKLLIKHYSGVNGHYKAKDIIFASGCGYFLSKDLVDLVLSKKNDWNHELIDDVAIGELLFNHGIKPNKNPRFDVYNTDNIPKDYFHYRLASSDRNKDIDNMYYIFNLKNGKN